MRLIKKSLEKLELKQKKFDEARLKLINENKSPELIEITEKMKLSSTQLNDLKAGIQLLKIGNQRKIYDDYSKIFFHILKKFDTYLLSTKDKLAFVKSCLKEALKGALTEEEITEALNKISEDSISTEGFPFTKQTVDPSTGAVTRTNLTRLAFRDFISKYFDPHIINGSLSFWDGKQFESRLAEFRGTIHSLRCLFNVDNFNEEKFIDDFFSAGMVRTECSNPNMNFIVPLQNVDLLIDKNNLDIDHIKILPKNPVRPVHNALNIILPPEVKDFGKWLRANRDSTEFKKFINGYSEDPAIINRISEIIGFQLIDDKFIKKGSLPIISGPYSTGKSLLLYLIQQFILGKDNITTINPARINDNFALMPAVGKRSNFVFECPDESLSPGNVAKFKALVSGDPLLIDVKYGEPIHILPKMGTIIAANQVPTFNYDEALLYRIQILPLKKQHQDKENIFDKPNDSFINAFFIFVFEGYLRLLKNRDFSECSACDVALEKFKNELDPVKEWLGEIDLKDLTFSNEDTTRFNSESEMIARTDQGIYSRFIEWAESGNYYPKFDYPSIMKFKKALQNHCQNLKVVRKRLAYFQKGALVKTQKYVFILNY